MSFVLKYKPKKMHKQKKHSLKKLIVFGGQNVFKNKFNQFKFFFK